MEKKQKILIASIIAFVLILLTVGLVLLSNVKKEDKATETGKTPVTEKVEEAEKKEKEKKPVEEDTVANESEELDDSKAVAMKTTTNLNLRKEPNTDSEIIKLISKGTELSKYSEENGWAKVLYIGDG